jgi:hypothetical protein
MWILSTRVESTDRDTSAVLALAASNTLASASTKTTHKLITWSQFADRQMIRNNNYLRIWVDPDLAAATDTVIVRAIYTISYPPGP